MRRDCPESQISNPIQPGWGLLSTKCLFNPPYGFGVTWMRSTIVLTAVTSTW